VNALPKVLLAGGPDIDARLDLMRHLRGAFNVSAMGSSPSLSIKLSAEGFEYSAYRLTRKANPVLDLLTFAQSLIVLRRLRPQIVHAFDSKPSVWVRLAARLTGVPVVVGTLPGLGSLYTNKSRTTRLIRLFYEKLQTLACRVADLTVFQNHEDARRFVSAGIVSHEKMAVIVSSGVSTGTYDPGRIPRSQIDSVGRELGIRPDALVVSMIARIIRSKGVLEYAAAARQLRDRYPNVDFLLVGAEDPENLDRLSSEELSEVREALTWQGPRPDIPAVLALSDIFVLPSAYGEGVPRVLLEAASMGLPIVTTDMPGCREVVEDRVNGFLVAVHDVEALCKAVGCLIEQPELRKRFGRLSRQRAVQRFDTFIVAEQTRSIYRQLLTKKAHLLPAAS